MKKRSVTATVMFPIAKDTFALFLCLNFIFPFLYKTNILKLDSFDSNKVESKRFEWGHALATLVTNAWQFVFIYIYVVGVYVASRFV